MDNDTLWAFGLFTAGVVVGWLARCNWIGNQGNSAPVEPTSQATEHPEELNTEEKT